MFQRRDVCLIKSDGLDAKGEADNPVWDQGLSIRGAEHQRRDVLVFERTFAHNVCTAAQFSKGI